MIYEMYEVDHNKINLKITTLILKLLDKHT